MKKFLTWILTILLVLSMFQIASAESQVYTLGNDVVVNTTPFVDADINKRYILHAGTVVTIVGEYNGWKVINYGDEYGTLFIETGNHNCLCNSDTVLVPIEDANAESVLVPIEDVDSEFVAVRGVINAKSVWARYEPKNIFADGEDKGDLILHRGDEVEIVGEIVVDEEGNKYYPIKIEKDGYCVRRYVTAKYVDIPVDE